MSDLVSRPKAGYIPTLDGWRAVAIAGVMLFRGGPFFPGHARISAAQNLGAYGVELFFAISGLLICSRLMDEEDAKGSISLKAFYVRRFFRIQPAALTYLGVVGLLAVVEIIAFDRTGWWTAMIALRNWYRPMYPGSGTVYTAHFWSLAIEEHFYFVMPWLLIFLRGRNRTRWFGVAALLSLAIFEASDRSASVHLMSGSSELELCWLFLAAWLALFIRKKEILTWFQRYLQPGPMLACVSLIAVGLVFQWKFIAHLWLPSFPFLVLSTMLHPRSMLGRILELAPLRWIGRISYSLYLWQQLFCISLHGRGGPKWPLAMMQHRPQNYLFPFGFALLSYFFIEKPFIRVGHRLSATKTVQLQAV